MKSDPAYEDAIDLLDADHKLVKKLFIDFGALVEDEAPAQFKQELVAKICKELTVHAQLEEEIFYPAVREATGDEALLDHAEEEHAEAKEMIAKLEGMQAGAAGYDDEVKALGLAIDQHVLEEREQIFLKAKYAEMDLRGMVPELVARKKQLQGSPQRSGSAAGKRGKSPAKKEHA